MICFKDRTFCTDPACTCERRLTLEVIAAAQEWWGSPDAPTSTASSCFCGRVTNHVTNVSTCDKSPAVTPG